MTATQPADPSDGFWIADPDLATITNKLNVEADTGAGTQMDDCAYADTGWYHGPGSGDDFDTIGWFIQFSEAAPIGGGAVQPLIRISINWSAGGDHGFSPGSNGTVYWEVTETDEPDLWDEDGKIDCSMLTGLVIPFTLYTEGVGTVADITQEFITGVLTSQAEITGITLN